jgi:hypothetical protein
VTARIVTGQRTVFRIEWLPGSDRLRGRCHCGAVAEAEDPVQMWQWLLAHPAHPASPAQAASPAQPGEPGEPGPC